MERNEQVRVTKKLNYSRPQLVRFGDVKVLTKANTGTGLTDGGTSPNDKTS
jgi:hypothetical protein